MRAVENSQFGTAKADLIADMRSIEERARRVRRMVEADEPTIDILSALSLLRADVRSFGMITLQARLQQQGALGTGGVGQGNASGCAPYITALVRRTEC